MPAVKTLVTFNGNDGSGPFSDLIIDNAGDLFGTTENASTVFEIVNTGGNYANTPTTLTTLNGTDGANPLAGVVADSAGDLFGTTLNGGASNEGVVFELPKTSAGYATTPITLVSFNGTNGAEPYASLIVDSAGDLLGTTKGGGSAGDGTVFEITKTATGYASAPVTLANFNTFNEGNNPDAPGNPEGALIEDSEGDLFGTTPYDSSNASGTVFELVNHGSGNYTLDTLAVFDGPDGQAPAAGLIEDAAGDLFGTTEDGGANGDGTVFEIPYINGAYALTPITLASFNGPDGAYPVASLIIDNAGNLFGTTYEGGANLAGSVFEIAKSGSGYDSTPITLVSLGGALGANPKANLVADAAGDLFGTTSEGGSGNGTVFEITNSGFVAAPTTPPTNAFTIVDSTSGATTSSAGQAYTGPVAGITSEFVTNTSDILNVTANVANSFIEVAPPSVGGPPTLCGINVSVANGNNVLDAYGNSNFYTGGTGTDQFYEDARTLTSNSWSTIVNFHSGDNITIWGVTAADFNLDWIGDTYGAAGSTGLTGVLVPTTVGQPEVAVTLAGFKAADATDGKIALSYGQTQSQNGVAGSTYLSIHAV